MSLFPAASEVGPGPGQLSDSGSGAKAARSGVVASTLFGLVIAGSALTGTALAQDYTHPRDMDLPAPAFERPDPASLQLQLDNGIVAYVAGDHRAPLATLTVYLGIGTGHGADGAAPALAAALRAGPADLPAGEFNARLDDMFAVYSVTQHSEETVVHIDVPVEHAWRGASLVADTLAGPRFAAAPGATPSGDATAEGGIDYGYTLDRAVARFHEPLFDGHPFRRNANGKGGADAARALLEEGLRAGNIAVAFAGDFNAGSARRELAGAFGRVPVGAPLDEPRGFAMPGLPERRQLLLEDVDRDQGWVVIGHELPVVPAADEAALHVMDYILGAYHLDSRLYRNSRERRGLTNDNSSFLETGVHGPGAYSFRTYGRPEAVRLLVEITFEELGRMRETLPTDDELFVARGALVDGLYAERYATGTAATRAYAREWLHHGGHERSASYPQRIRAVTGEDVRAAAAKYLHPERAIITVIGPLGRIADAQAMEGEPQLESWATPPDTTQINGKNR
jgi:zinc protease